MESGGTASVSTKCEFEAFPVFAVIKTIIGFLDCYAVA